MEARKLRDAVWSERNVHISQKGFVQMTKPLIEFMRPYGPFVDVGAGTGWMSKVLNDNGIGCLPTDRYKRTPDYAFEKFYGDIERLRGCAAIEKYDKRNVIMSWPSYNAEWPTRALYAINPDQKLMYLGERHGGCTGSDKFHEYLERHFEEIDWFGYAVWDECYIRDSLSVFRRKHEG